ncbi:SusC/RagA family TonB-linked outer membrane protein [Maribellus maritimus]|uniref:SusC/RagA family TonB-linked outer membrane protein n=1 Tax=Maribellus maritimus TaxID=2870838 RepID=UPI001EEC5326|nr:TonB-dependent receptor [Maribellus maritimus]MCG6187208.1 TonB-dependent receptor [Maribellus maritimus]
MKKLLLIVMALFMGISSLFAQTKRVTGKVTSAEDNSPIPGVSVSVKGTTIGTITGIEGDYALTVPNDAVLVFSFVGMKTTELPVTAGLRHDIQLEMEVMGVDEVMVVAYGTQKRRAITNAVTKVNSAELEKMPVTSIENALSGQAAGLQINTGSRSGEANTIRIRGTSSISASSQPLFVIDGIPQGDYQMGYAGNNTQTSPLSTLNPNDIENIQVLKDASAAALYGSRASNGVIMITTKRGKSGKTQINLNYYSGFQEATNFMDALNGSEYTELFNEAYFNSTGVANILGNPEDAIDTDWLDAVSRKGLINQYDFSANGGNERTQFYTGVSYREEEGYTIGNDFQRINIRTNIDHEVSDFFKIGTNISVARTFNNRVSNNNSVASMSTSGILQYPNVPIYGDGSEMYGPEGTYYLGKGVNPNNNIAYNLLNEVDENIHEAITVRPQITTFGEFTFFDDIKFKSEWSLDYIDLSEKIFWGLNSGDGGGSNGVSQALSYRNTNWITTNTLSYDKVFDEKHQLSVIAGYSFQENRLEQSNVTGEQFPNNDLWTVNNAAEITNGGGSISQFAIESYFARLNYSYLDKYLLEVSLRRDGSSRFGADNRYANFPAVSLGWIVSDENFMRDMDWLSLAKIRTSYGFTGNAEFLTSSTDPRYAVAANFPALGLYGGDLDGSDYGGSPGLSPTQLANPDLKWEQTAQLDLGVNLGLFKNRIDFEADYYYKKTTDLLLDVQIPASGGFTSIAKNLGELENKGWEFALNTRNFVGKFRWNTNFNISFNKNKITDLKGEIIENSISRAMEGQPIGVYYTVKFAGVNPDTGESMFYDLNGNKTTTYSNDYRQIVGDPNPDYIGGITNNFAWNNFDFSVQVQFVQGNDIYFDAGRYCANSMALYFNNLKDQLDRWQEPGDITNIPKAVLFDSTNRQHSSRFVEDGSFVRVKTVSLGYNIPSQVLTKANIHSVRIYTTAYNFWTFTNYRGHDPEVSSEGTLNVGQGIDFFQAPPSKSLIFGVNIGF